MNIPGLLLAAANWKRRRAKMSSVMPENAAGKYGNIKSFNVLYLCSESFFVELKLARYCGGGELIFNLFAIFDN